MKNKLLLATIGIIIVAVIGLVLFVKIQFPKEIIKPEVKEEKPIEEIMKIMLEAAKKRDALVCEKLESEERKKQCQDKVIMVQAIDQKDIELCQKVEDETARMTCQDNLILVQAIDTRDSTLCEKMKDEARIGICKKKVAALK